MKKYILTLIFIAAIAALAACGNNDYAHDYDYDNQNQDIDMDNIEANYIYISYPEEECPEAETETEPEIITTSLDYALARAYQRRLGIIKPDYTLLLPLLEDRIPGPLPDFLFEAPEVWPESVTIAQAQEDVEIFFAALRSAYAGYEYFGGDAVF